jgi:hypothetical protein
MIEDTLLREIAAAASVGDLIEVEGRIFRPGLVDFDNRRILLRAVDNSEAIILHSNAHEFQDHLVED